jgi:hypothetical protein
MTFCLWTFFPDDVLSLTKFCPQVQFSREHFVLKTFCSPRIFWPEKVLSMIHFFSGRVCLRTFCTWSNFVSEGFVWASLQTQCDLPTLPVLNLFILLMHQQSTSKLYCGIPLSALRHKINFEYKLASLSYIFLKFMTPDWFCDVVHSITFKCKYLGYVMSDFAPISHHRIIFENKHLG